MKKFLATFLVMAMMAIALPLAANAQTRNSRNSRNYNRRTNYTRVEKRPSFYRRHRNLINVGIGAGGGTIVGALIGGRKGALIGAAAGAGGGALYTYVLNKKKRRY